MIIVDFFERDCGLKITNDKIFEEIVVHVRDYDHEKEIVSELLKSFIENN